MNGSNQNYNQQQPIQPGMVAPDNSQTRYGFDQSKQIVNPQPQQQPMQQFGATNGQQVYIPQQPMGDMSTLGNVNTNNASATILGATAIPDKVDDDTRKIKLDVTGYTIENYCEYLKQYLANTQMFVITDVVDQIKQILGIPQMFILQSNTSGQAFLIIPILENSQANTSNNVITALQSILPQHPEINLPPVKVGFGHENFPDAVKKSAKSVNMELVGYSEIYEINNAIQQAYNRMPYMGFGNTFAMQLAKGLNGMYRQMMSGQPNPAMNNFGQGVKQVGQGFGAAIMDGINQLKQSFSGLGASFNQARNQQIGMNGQQQGMNYQQPGMNYQQPGMQNGQPVMNYQQPGIGNVQQDINMQQQMGDISQLGQSSIVDMNSKQPMTSTNTFNNGIGQQVMNNCIENQQPQTNANVAIRKSVEQPSVNIDKQVEHKEQVQVSLEKQSEQPSVNLEKANNNIQMQSDFLDDSVVDDGTNQ